MARKVGPEPARIGVKALFRVFAYIANARGMPIYGGAKGGR